MCMKTDDFYSHAQFGLTALSVASYQGEEEIVDMLISAGANLNIQNEVTNCFLWTFPD